MIYFVKLDDFGKVKVGYADIVADRLRQLRRDYGQITFLFAFDGDLMDEQELHREFRHSGGRNFWRKPRVERYDMPDEEISALRERFRGNDGYTEEEGTPRARVNLFLPRETSEFIRKYARKNDMSTQGVIESLLVSWVENYKKREAAQSHKAA